MLPQSIFLSLFIIAGDIMKSPDEKNAMCQACTDTDGRFSYCCDYLHHNDESRKSQKKRKKKKDFDPVELSKKISYFFFFSVIEISLQISAK